MMICSRCVFEGRTLLLLLLLLVSLGHLESVELGVLLPTKLLRVGVVRDRDRRVRVERRPR
jgi:hypothetical protein